MAKEITLTLQGRAKKANFATQWPDTAAQIDQAAGGEYAQTWKVGTAEEDLTITDLTTPGIILLQNIEAAGSGKNVRWGPKSAGAMVAIGLLLPGEFAVFRLDQTGPPTIRAINVGLGNASIQVRVLEN